MADLKLRIYPLSLYFFCEYLPKLAFPISNKVWAKAAKVLIQSTIRSIGFYRV